MNMREGIGYLAGLLVTISFLPQVLKIVKARSAADISLGMYLLFCSGVALWLMYGLLLSSWPVIVSNFVTLILSGIILGLKIRHGNGDPRT